jgi:uncharacterized protein YfaS (alpha-2-macroglobulin family)
VAFSDQATALVFGSRGDFGSYWSLAQSGFDLQPAKKALSNKLEIVREFLGGDDKPIAKVGLGEEISVRIRVRALDAFVTNLAIVDLLPAGFEVVMQTASQEASAGDNAEGSSQGEESSGGEGGEGEAQGQGEGEGESESEGEGEAATANAEATGQSSGALSVALPGSTFSVDYVDVREDRVVVYGSVGKEMATFLYKIKATNVGKVITPAIHAESMYERAVRARGEPGSISVVRP